MERTGFAPGQIVTVFRNRLDPAGTAEYEARAVEILALARTMPGLVDVKTFTADDGERVTIATFADQPSHDAWRQHAEHRLAQAEGRDRYYAEYSTQVCQTVRATAFTRGDGRTP